MDDIYINILKYARENLKSGVTKEEGIKFIKKTMALPKDINDVYYNVYSNLFSNVFDEEISTSSNISISGDNARYFIKMNAYFQLLSYEELEEARASAKRARRHSLIAIAIAVVLGIIQTFLMLKPNPSYTTLSNIENDKSQFEEPVSNNTTPFLNEITVITPTIRSEAKQENIK